MFPGWSQTHELNLLSGWDCRPAPPRLANFCILSRDGVGQDGLDDLVIHPPWPPKWHEGKHPSPVTAAPPSGCHNEQQHGAGICSSTALQEKFCHIQASILGCYMQRSKTLLKIVKEVRTEWSPPQHGKAAVARLLL
ncbi:hypothetical protein AAY473_036783 [Plecturocebus cupreus]